MGVGVDIDGEALGFDTGDDVGAAVNAPAKYKEVKSKKS